MRQPKTRSMAISVASSTPKARDHISEGGQSPHLRTSGPPPQRVHSWKLAADGRSKDGMAKTHSLSCSSLFELPGSGRPFTYAARARTSGRSARGDDSRGAYSGGKVARTPLPYSGWCWRARTSMPCLAWRQCAPTRRPLQDGVGHEHPPPHPPPHPPSLLPCPSEPQASPSKFRSKRRPAVPAFSRAPWIHVTIATARRKTATSAAIS